MNWTTPNDIRHQVQRLWDRGLLLSALCDEDSLFPYRLTLKTPNSRELSERFDEVREWISLLSKGAGPYRVEWQSINHRILGTNSVPSEVWIDSMDHALGIIGRRKAAEQFSRILDLTKETRPELLPWLKKRPLQALELVDIWPQLLSVTNWLRNHPRPGIHLRQIDLPGIHTKLIEGHRGVLSELFDLVLPEESLDKHYSGVSGFCRRYGFKEKPMRVRFRMLDPDIRLMPGSSDQDITLTHNDFSALNLPVSKIFITENEINFLAFPYKPNAMLLFGAGYGFANIADAHWLQQRKVYYWGDIDTHGFAILNQFRKHFPHTESFLMDRQTLMDHKLLWGEETQPKKGELSRLTTEEYALYEDLKADRFADRLRLEQERIGFEYLRAALEGL